VVDVQSENGIVMVRPLGRIDASTSKAFEKTMDEVLQQDAVVVVDMSDVPYISSCGLRVFVAAGKRLMGTGKLAAAALQASVLHEFELVGLTRIIRVFDDVAAAKACCA
ncbi:MAG: STAS domain-containing protein, partial [Pirellulales bacterium]|nr:STAS domain-containing protein [Pirellulales bacterium]